MKVLIGPNPMGLEKGLPGLRQLYPDVELVHCADQAGLTTAIADADAFCGWITQELMLAAKKLRWVQSPSSGVDRFLAVPEMAQRDIILTSARGTHGGCLGDSVFGMILAFTRRIRELVLAQRDHRWVVREFRPLLVELTGMTIGIIGLGVVGRAVAQRAHGFDMRVIAVDRFSADRPDYVEWLRGLDGLGDLLAQADFVVVTVPYTQDTQHLLGAAELALMKDGALLVGISRGGIIDEAALLEQLRSGRISAALDVFAQEPLPADSPLWDLPNVLVTPHVAGGTQYEGKYILEILAENIGRFVKGQLPLRNQVDKQRGF